MIAFIMVYAEMLRLARLVQLRQKWVCYEMVEENLVLGTGTFVVQNISGNYWGNCKMEVAG